MKVTSAAMKVTSRALRSSRSFRSSGFVRPFSGAASALALLAAFALPAGAAPKAMLPRLSGHIPAAIAHSHLLGRVASTQTVGLALTLPLRNQAGLTDLIARLSTPGDPQYGHFLTPAQFTARFGPTAGDYAAVAAAAQKMGLQVTGMHPNRLILDVSGPASVVESAFSLHLQRYRSAEGREFFAPDAGPALSAGLAGRVSGVVGLDNALHLRPHLRQAQRPSLLSKRAGSGPYGGLSPSDVKNAYSLHTGATGTGQVIALYELDGYTPSDIRAYETEFGLPAVPLQNILVDGANGSSGDSTGEVTLDIELATALAPGVSKILVYETPNLLTTTDQTYIDGYNRIATDNIAKQISTSWGGPEDQSNLALLNGENSVFQEMAAQGQTIVAVTGDNGAYDDGSTLSVDDPGSQPYVTGVGGTSLATNGTGGTYGAETVWGLPYNVNDPNSTDGGAFGVGGGGGFSTVWPAPSYQDVLPLAPAMRSVPDVALDSDPETGYAIYYGGQWQVYGGTSAAAPLWAGFTALVNQQRAAAGKPTIGFLNPPIYQIGASQAYNTNFHDVTHGDNLYYPAETGYDNATGWGSFIGDALLGTLAQGLTPAPTGTVIGTITAADTGAVLPGVTVSVLSVSGNVSVSTATTNASGIYTLSAPAGIPFSIAVSAYTATGGRYAGAKVSAATVGTGQTEGINAVLQPAHTFAAGIQMISSPYNYSAVGDFDTVFGINSAAASTTRLIAWNPSTDNYVFYPTAPANTLTPGVGYWVNFPTAAYSHYDGALAQTSTPFTLDIETGWNLIGDPFPAAVPLSSVTVGGINGNGTALTASPGISPTLYRYDTPSGQYVAVNAATDSLQPYVGYWLYVSQSSTQLNVPAP
jgi:subtilase family serine protease